MSKLTTIVIACLSLAVIILALGTARGTQRNDLPDQPNLPTFDTPYQAVLLDNGQVYYGKITGLGSNFPQMTDAYYIVRTENPQTKQPKNVLVKRGNELHAPTKTFLDARHIVMIEPVGMTSQVEQLIVQSQSQPQGQSASPQGQAPLQK